MTKTNNKTRIITIDPENTSGIRKLLFWGLKRQTRGFIPGVFKIITVNMNVGIPMMWLVNYLGMRKSAPLSRIQQEMVATVVNGIIGGAPWLGSHLEAVRRLTGDAHIQLDFATTWPTYDLDSKTRALLGYTKKLTEMPNMIDDSDIEALRAVGWDEKGIYHATALISFFNMSGRMEAASGLPLDVVPVDARLP